MKRFSFHKILFSGIFLFLFTCASSSPKISHAIILVMDGARYSETLGDTTHANVPGIYALSQKGMNFDNFVTATVDSAHGGKTETCPGHSRITTGTYQNIANNGSELPTMPSIFQYFLKKTKKPATIAWVITSKDKLRILANTSSKKWAGKYTPSFNCGISGDGSGGYREDSLTHAIVKQTLKHDHPALTIINYKGPDAMGHANNWNGYIAAIKEVDKYAADLWNTIQADSVLKDRTILWIVNDHGRHTNDFTSHGDTCWGCRHILSVVVGPGVKENSKDNSAHEQIDIAPTIAKMMGFSMPTAKGKVLLGKR